MFQFTIREAILMTTIVAVLLMWWMERSQNGKYEARLTAIETRLKAFPAFAPIVPVTAQPPAFGSPVPVSFTVLPPASGTLVPAPPTTSAPPVRGTTIPSGPVVRPGTMTIDVPSEPPPPVAR